MRRNIFFLVRSPFCAALCAVIPAALSAQQVSHPARWQPAVGVYVGSPQRASVGVGVMWVVRRARDFSSASGPRILVEPGMRAVKMRAGYAVSGPSATGYSLEASTMRDWSRGGRHSNFYGIEAHGSLMFVDLGIGAYIPMQHGNEARFALSGGLVL